MNTTAPAMITPRFQEPVGREGRLVDIRAELPPGVFRSFYAAIERPLERLLGVTRFNEIHAGLIPLKEPERFFPEWLAEVGAGYVVSPEDVAKIPRTGPLFVIANHPFGGVDGMILGAIVIPVREDYKLLANGLLGRARGIRPFLIPVNPFGGQKAARENTRSMQDALRHLKEGGCLATFPAGEVSSFSFKTGRVADPAWSPHIVRLARRSGATVLPVWFSGRNSLFFQIAGLISPRLRTALLVRELINKKGVTVRVRIGDPIPAATLPAEADDATVTALLRERVEAAGRE